MSFNNSSQRSFVVYEPYESVTSREHVSNRNNITSIGAIPHITPRDPSINEGYYPSDNRHHILSDAIRKFRGLVNGECSQSIDEGPSESSVCNKDDSHTDVDELFENFDRCYQARFPSGQGSTSVHSITTNPLPVCRDLIRELSIESPKIKTIMQTRKKSPANFSGSRLQRPKEFKPLKAEKYFNVRSSSNVNNNANNKQAWEEEKTRCIGREENHREVPQKATNQNQCYRSTNIVHIKNESIRNYEEPKVSQRDEDYSSNRDEENLPVNSKKFMFVQNAAFSMIDSHYQAVQQTLNKLRKREGRDAFGDQAVLYDITNHHDNSGRRASMKETREYKVNNGDLTKRKNWEKESIEHKRTKSNNGQKKINVSQMLASYYGKENNFPTGRSSYNGDRSKSKEGRKGSSRILGEKPNSNTKENQEKKIKKPSVLGERHSNNLDKNERDLMVNKEGSSTYKVLLKYFELGKRSTKAGETVNQRSTSANRW